MTGNSVVCRYLMLDLKNWDESKLLCTKKVLILVMYKGLKRGGKCRGWDQRNLDVCVEYAKLVYPERKKENECYLGDANFVLHALT